MEEKKEIQEIIERLNKKMPFALFGTDHNCYFKDGTQVSYTHLWKSIKIIKNIPDGQSCGTLHELFPDIFEGVFTYKFSKHSWKKGLIKLRTSN